MNHSPVSDKQWNEFIARRIEYLPWKKWFAWYPVRVHGQRTWLKTVYRRKVTRYVDTDSWSIYEYGTVFDLLIE